MKLRLLAALVVLSSAVSLLAQTPPPNAEQCVAGVVFEATLAEMEGERNGTKPNYAKAMQKADDCVRQYATVARAWTKRGDVHLWRSDLDAAIADYTKAIEVDPKERQAYVQRGFAQLKGDKFEAALADYNKALEIEPTDVDALIGRGDTYRV